MASIFSKVPIKRNKRSKFNLSYDTAFTARFGECIPCYFEDVIPSDHFKISAAPFVRMSPMSAPMMGRLNVAIPYFYVPYRIMWDEWEKFITGGSKGTSLPTMPFLPASSGDVDNVDRLFDFFGLCSVSQSGAKYKQTRPRINMLQWRAYWKVINDYYRDENLQEDMFDDTLETFISTKSGMVSDLPGFNSVIQGQNIYQPFNKCWKKDLFTSGLPFAQRGAPVEIPVSAGEVFYNPESTQEYHEIIAIKDVSTPNLTLSDMNALPGPSSGKLTSRDPLQSFSINDLRAASATQRFLERNAIGGYRIKEQILSHFGVTVPDYRIDRPEFLAGVKTPVLTSQVLQTSSTNADSVLGTQGGHGVASGVMKPASYSVKEHGCIIGIASIIPDAYYSQGVHRMYQKFDKFDYFFPYFEDLGEQAIMNSELYPTATASDNSTFAYAPRYYEYKARNNIVTGNFRTSLAYWIPQRIFTSPPALNPDFIQVNPAKESSLNNIFAVTDPKQDQFYCIVSNAVLANRPISRWSSFSLT